VDGQALRAGRLRRRVPASEHSARSVHVVVESRSGTRQERRLAHRLSGREPLTRRQGALRVRLQGSVVLGSRAARDGLRPVSVGAAPATAAKPRLSDVFGSPKMVAIALLAASSGFPNQLTESALQAWLKEAGATNTMIGLVSYVAIPYLLKFLWAPL